MRPCTMARFENPTRNQHFISQSEQRLNAINPGAERRERRIYAFRVVDRAKLVVAHDQDKGVSLLKNLSFDDLFSLDIRDRSRLNLEECFQRYERDVAMHTKALLKKLQPGQDVKAEFINLFASKFLNLLRNPFSAKKVLNLLGEELSQFKPTAPELLEAYTHLESPKPHHEPILRAFDLTTQDYRRWLKSLFLVVAVDVEGRPILDHVVKNILEGTLGHATIYRYSDSNAQAVCLLSDRGINDLSPRDTTNTTIMWDFNLTAKSFIRLGLADLKASVAKHLPHLRSDMADQVRKMIQGNHTVEIRDNDFAALANYNANAVTQCANQVYCAGRFPHGIHVVRRTRSGAWRSRSPSRRSRTLELALAQF